MFNQFAVNWPKALRKNSSFSGCLQVICIGRYGHIDLVSVTDVFFYHLLMVSYIILLTKVD